MSDKKIDRATDKDFMNGIFDSVPQQKDKPSVLASVAKGYVFGRALRHVSKKR